MDFVAGCLGGKSNLHFAIWSVMSIRCAVLFNSPQTCSVLTWLMWRNSIARLRVYFRNSTACRHTKANSVVSWNDDCAWLGGRRWMSAALILSQCRIDTENNVLFITVSDYLFWLNMPTFKDSKGYSIESITKESNYNVCLNCFLTKGALQSLYQFSTENNHCRSSTQGSSQVSTYQRRVAWISAHPFTDQSHVFFCERHGRPCDFPYCHNVVEFREDVTNKGKLPAVVWRCFFLNLHAQTLKVVCVPLEIILLPVTHHHLCLFFL